MSKNQPYAKVILGGLQTQNSRIFPSSCGKAPLFKELQALKENPVSKMYYLRNDPCLACVY